MANGTKKPVNCLILPPFLTHRSEISNWFLNSTISFFPSILSNCAKANSTCMLNFPFLWPIYPHDISLHKFYRQMVKSWCNKTCNTISKYKAKHTWVINTNQTKTNLRHKRNTFEQGRQSYPLQFQCKIHTAWETIFKHAKALLSMSNKYRTKCKNQAFHNNFWQSCTHSAKYQLYLRQEFNQAIFAMPLISNSPKCLLH